MTGNNTTITESASPTATSSPKPSFWQRLTSRGSAPASPKTPTNQPKEQKVAAAPATPKSETKLQPQTVDYTSMSDVDLRALYTAKQTAYDNARMDLHRSGFSKEAEAKADSLGTEWSKVDSAWTVRKAQRSASVGTMVTTSVTASDPTPPGGPSASLTPR